jgi:hypothetical protein
MLVLLYSQLETLLHVPCSAQKDSRFLIDARPEFCQVFRLGLGLTAVRLKVQHLFKQSNFPVSFGLMMLLMLAGWSW